MRTSCLSAASLLLGSSLAFSATTSINTVNSVFALTAGQPLMPVTDENGVDLEAGTASDHDGDIIQIGVLESHTVGGGPGELDPSDPTTWPAPDFASFVPLTGLGSANAVADPSLLTTIGDGATTPGFIDGFYSIGVTLDDTVHPDVPFAAEWIAIRFFNSKTDSNTTGANGVRYNTVAAFNAAWLSKPPASPAPTPSNADLDNHRADLVWEDDPNMYLTTIPEPSVTLLGALGLGVLLRRRR